MVCGDLAVGGVGMCHLQFPTTLATPRHPHVTPLPPHSPVPMHPLPTLCKARNLPRKRPVCAICIDRTRGHTQEIRLGYRVAVWLCPGHADHAFQTRRGGRDLARTLMGVWQANGCLTAARHRALDAHLTRLRAHRKRTRPGSYAWPDLRRRLEAHHAHGAPPLTPTPHPCHTCTAHTPATAPSNAGTPNGAGSQPTAVGRSRRANGEGQDRTGDTTIFSRVLYQLSYLAGRRTVYRPGVRTRESATASGTVLPLREGRCDPLHHSTFSAPGQVNSP